MTRLTPFDLVFRELAEEYFPAIRDALGGEGVPWDRDAFLLNREAATLTHHLRPDDGLGSHVDHLAGLVHMAYLAWHAGGWVFRPTREATTRLLVVGNDDPVGRPPAYYLQLPHGMVWGQLAEAAPHQPLDGCFVAWPGSAQLRVLGIFGLHEGRMAFDVAEAAGSVAEVRRLAGDQPFRPAMDGGREAGLYSVNDMEELLLLAVRTAPAITRMAPMAAEDSPREVEIV